ncbi:hypothetical protein MKW92_028675 [Papaver armeniacum]|nr:hypothetical protein MKW92_028675 [Papaver armeniacum]
MKAAPVSAEKKSIKERKKKMIKEALLALNEKGGSSPYVIAKYMEEKHKDVLPAKMLGVQLKNCVANQKLIKIKASFKLSDASKKEIKAKAVVPKPKSVKYVAAADEKAKKRKRPTTSSSKIVKSAAAIVPKPKTTTVKKSETTAAPKKKKIGAPVKKVAVADAKKIAPGKKTRKAITPVKAKHPKSIKSPAAKRAKKTAAA